MVMFSRQSTTPGDEEDVSRYCRFILYLRQSVVNENSSFSNPHPAGVVICRQFGNANLRTDLYVRLPGHKLIHCRGVG